MSQQKKSADLLLTNGLLLPLSPGSKPIPRGGVAIANGKIAGLGKEVEIGASFDPRRTIDARGGLIMPGLINGHTHAAMSLLRGLADDLPLKTWLEEHIFPAEAKWVNGDFVYWGALLSCAEMIRSGTTTFIDGYFFEEQTARAVGQSGMRALLGQGVLDFPTPDSPSPAHALKRAEELLRAYTGSIRIRPAVFPHAVYTCAPKTLEQCHDLAERYKAPLIIHLAESRSEIEEVMNRYGRGPIEHLERLGLLSPRLIAKHCVWLSEADMDLLARRGVPVVHNPESNMKLASGVAPVPDLLARGIAIGLGTDGCASNNNLDLFQEMDSAAKLHKVHRLDPTVMPSHVVLEMATFGGARVLGMEKEIGSLEVGKKADVIVLDINHPHLQPIYNIPSHLVYSATGADVRDVIIDGRLVMENRVILSFDEELVLAKAREWQKKICGEMGVDK